MAKGFDHKHILVRVPLALPTIALVSGIAFAWYIPVPFSICVIIATLSLLTAWAMMYRNIFRTAARILLLAGIFAIGAARLTGAYNSIRTDAIVTFAGRNPIFATIRGTVSSFPLVTDSRNVYDRPIGPATTMLVDVDEIRTSKGWVMTCGTIRTRIRDRVMNINPGDRIQLVGSMGRYLPPENPGGFDYQKAGKTSGIHVWFHVPVRTGATVVEKAEGLWTRLIGRWRAAAKSRLMESEPLSGHLANAMILGERHPALGSLNETMRRAGIAHFLSISGMYLGIFLGFFYLICRIAMLPPGTAAWAVIGALAAYLALAECRAPLLRSAVMSSSIAAGVIAGRRNSSLNALCFAAVILLAIDPVQLMMPGFQMSFAIVAGIILIHPSIRNLLFSRWIRLRGLMVFRDSDRFRRWLWFKGGDWGMSMVSISITAYLAAAPLVACRFGLFSPYAILLSILLLPLVAAVLIPGYIALALSWIMPSAASAFGSISSSFASALSRSVELIDGLPGLSFELYPIPPIWVFLCYATIVFLLLANRSRKMVPAAASTALPLAIITIWTQLPHSPNSEAELHLLSVGSAQCCVLQTPDGESFLLDAGSRSGPLPGQRILNPFLRTKKIPYPAGAFISHANSDHYNVLPEMIYGGHAQRIYISDHFHRDEDPASPISLLVDLIERRCSVIRLRQSDRIKLADRLAAEILWPPATLPDTIDSNDRSLVIRLDCSGTSVLIPGDIGPDVQEILCRNPGKIKSDIIILPHHGKWERTLEHFVRAVNPRMILVSCGRDQELPFSDLSGKDRKHYSTSRNGWIKVRFGKGGIEVESMR